MRAIVLVVVCGLVATAPVAVGAPAQPANESSPAQSGGPGGSGATILGGTSSNGSSNVTATASAPPPPGSWSLLFDDGTGESRTVGDVDEVYTQHTSDTLYFRITYEDLTTHDEFDTAIFLDTDRDQSTGGTSTSLSYYVDGIGADYVGVVGWEGDAVWEWNASTDQWGQDTSGFAYKDVDYAANTVVVGIDRNDVDDPSAVDVLVTDANGASTPSSEWDYAPDRGDGHLTVQLSGSSGDLQVTVSQVDRSGFPRIDAFVTVQDGNGNPVGGLTASDFAVREDGTAQSIVSVQQIGGSGTDVSTSLVLDRSGSMQGSKLSAAQTASKQFVGELRADDEAQVITFGDGTYTVAQRWTRNEATLNSTIDSIGASGGTALWEAAYEGVTEAGPRTGQSAVVLLTDGRDTSDPSPSRSLQDVIDEAQARGVPVYAIAFGSNPAETELQRLASQTGGAYYRAPSASDLDDVYRRISQRISNQYRVRYRTSNTATDGTTRNVEVTAFHGGSQGSDTGSYVAPCAPLPDAAYTYTTSGRQVTFDASGSDPNGGSIVAYRWDFDNDGQVDATGQQVTHTYGSDGTYEAKLIVEKGCGVLDREVKQITVSGGTGGTIRRLSTTTVPDGGTVTVTLETTASQSRVSFSESFQPPFDSASIQSVTIDGQPAPPLVAAADPNGVVVTLNGVPTGSRVRVQYAVTVPPGTPDGTTFDVDGEVTTSGTTRLPTDQVTVQQCSNLGGVAVQYDANGDCAIDIGELGVASADYASGAISVAELGQVASAYAQTSP